MTADDLQVCALTFAPQHTRAIFLNVFRSSLLQNLLEDGLYGPCGPSGAADRLYQCAGRHGERPLSSTGACNAVVVVVVVAWLACSRSVDSCVTGYSVHVLRARCVRGERVQ